jgi:hypothetical protein
MPTHSKTTIAGQLANARLALSNTLNDPEIQSMVAQFGYTAERMQEGQRLYDNALANMNAQAAAVGTQRRAVAQAALAEQQARQSYQALAQLCRAVFLHQPGYRAALGLAGPTPIGAAGFLKACETLFSNALYVVDIKGTLMQYGYDEARFERERAVIDAFGRAHQAQTAAKGATQHANRARRVALKYLNAWIAQYMKIAKIALRDKPELIEKLGGTARSAKTAAQRNAPRKAAETRAMRQAV